MLMLKYNPLLDYITDRRKNYMDIRNYCVECDMPRPCYCDLRDIGNRKWCGECKVTRPCECDIIAHQYTNNKPCDTE